MAARSPPHIAHLVSPISFDGQPVTDEWTLKKIIIINSGREMQWKSTSLQNNMMLFSHKKSWIIS